MQAVHVTRGAVTLLAQGVNADMQPALAGAIAAAAGRYGHVMFPENAHEPGVAAAQALLAGVGAGWAARVYFSSDGCGSARRGPPSRAVHCHFRVSGYIGLPPLKP